MPPEDSYSYPSFRFKAQLWKLWERSAPNQSLPAHCLLLPRSGMAPWEMSVSLISSRDQKIGIFIGRVCGVSMMRVAWPSTLLALGMHLAPLWQSAGRTAEPSVPCELHVRPLPMARLPSARYKLIHHCPGRHEVCRSTAVISLYMRCVHIPQRGSTNLTTCSLGLSTLQVHLEPLRAKPDLRRTLSVPFVTFSVESTGTVLAPYCSVQMRIGAGQRHEGIDVLTPRG